MLDLQNRFEMGLLAWKAYTKRKHSHFYIVVIAGL